MFKFLTKQFIYGRIYLWIKDKLGAILFLFISIFLIIYFHNEYLQYIEYKEKFAESYVGLSFVIKNILKKKQLKITVSIDERCFFTT